VSRPPILARFDVQVLKNKSSNDPAQVPASATIRFFQQGATHSGPPETVPYGGPEVPNPPPPTGIPVFHQGRLQIDDFVQVDAATTLVLTVTGIDLGNPNAPVVYVVNTTVAGGVAMASGARLLRKTGNAIVYLDATGAVPGGPAPVSFLTTNASTGRAVGYVAAYRYDYTVTGSGVLPRVHVDAVGSFVLRV
jgi:hypothetical protein